MVLSNAFSAEVTVDGAFMSFVRKSISFDVLKDFEARLLKG